MAIPLRASQIVQIGMDRQHDLSELRRPTSILSGPGHEALMMMDRLEQGRLEDIAGIEDAKGSVGETARPVGAHMREWRHEVGRAISADPTLDRNEIEIAEARHDPCGGPPAWCSGIGPGR